MIRVEHLSHSYGGNAAVKDVSFNVGRGELFGLIGSDGAGKTTIFRILATLIVPDSGSASINGYSVVDDYKKLRTLTGYMPGRFSLYQDLSVEENLRLFATLFGTSVEKNYDLIKDIYVQIEPFRKRKAGKLSGGMKQKLALCCALVHEPELLLLDEPTTGVDPVSRKEFWGMLARLKAKGITIVVSTPYMDEAVLCDRIAFIKEGEILGVNSPDAIISSFSKSILSIRADRMHRIKELLSGLEGMESIYSFGEVFHARLSGQENGISERMKELLTGAGLTGVGVEKAAPSIEDCFIEMIERKNDRSQ